MKKTLVTIFVLGAFTSTAFAAPARDPRTGAGITQNSQRVGVAPSVAVAPAPSVATTQHQYAPAQYTGTSSIGTTQYVQSSEKTACISMNVGSIGQDFVWASKESGGWTDYASMREDTRNPDNNACFVRVELRSTNPAVKINSARYYMHGAMANCGSWANADDIEDAILDATRGKRTGATIGVTVGSAAVGVGAMELFGNKWIGGKVMGQKDLEAKGKTEELLRSQLAVLDKENPTLAKQFRDKLTDLRAECGKEIWKNNPSRPGECDLADMDI